MFKKLIGDYFKEWIYISAAIPEADIEGMRSADQDFNEIFNISEDMIEAKNKKDEESYNNPDPATAQRRKELSEHTQKIWSSRKYHFKRNMSLKIYDILINNKKFRQICDEIGRKIYQDSYKEHYQFVIKDNLDGYGIADSVVVNKYNEIKLWLEQNKNTATKAEIRDKEYFLEVVGNYLKQ